MSWALVVRPGGIGDMLIASATLPIIRAQGYKIAFLAKRSRADAIRHDPHIDHLIEMPDDFAADWGDYYELQRKMYDRVIVLSDTIETTLVARQESPIWHWEPMALRAMCSDVSYLERTFACVGANVPARPPRFYATAEETAEAKAYREKMPGKFKIGIQLAGSAQDKAYPNYGRLISLLTSQIDCGVMVFAENSPATRELLEYTLVQARQWGDFSRVRNASNKTLRWSMTLAQHMDVMVGPDTGVMWGVSGNADVLKISLLGHATPKNITHLWANTITHHADPLKIGCWPCHRLHGGLDTCTPDPTGKWSACIASIKPETILEEIKAYLRGLHG